MELSKLKDIIDTTEAVEKLMMLGEKVFRNNDDAVCAITYFIERAYILGKQNASK